MRCASRAFLWTTLVLGCVAPSTAAAQERRGFWIGTDIGIASTDASADGIDLDGRGQASALDILAGWTVRPQLLIGVELNTLSVGVTRDGVFQDAGVVDVTATLTYYPRPSSGFFIKGGIGPSFFDDLEETPNVDISGTGVSAIVGTGYDIPLGRRLSLTTVSTSASALSAA